MLGIVVSGMDRFEFFSIEVCIVIIRLQVKMFSSNHGIDHIYW